MRRRNNVDIMADILRVARGGAKKTWIVYKANLNFKIVKEYLSGLMERGLLASPEESSMYWTTERGLNFLDQYDSFRKFHVVVDERSYRGMREEAWPRFQ